MVSPPLGGGGWGWVGDHRRGGDHRRVGVIPEQTKVRVQAFFLSWFPAPGIEPARWNENPILTVILRGKFVRELAHLAFLSKDFTLDPGRLHVFFGANLGLCGKAQESFCSRHHFSVRVGHHTCVVLWSQKPCSVQRRSLVSGVQVDLSKQACGSMAATRVATRYWGLDRSNEFGLPPFSKITAADFEPAFEFAMKEHLDDLRKIVEERWRIRECVCKIRSCRWHVWENCQCLSNLCVVKKTCRR